VNFKQKMQSHIQKGVLAKTNSNKITKHQCRPNQCSQRRRPVPSSQSRPIQSSQCRELWM